MEGTSLGKELRLSRRSPQDYKLPLGTMKEKKGAHWERAWGQC